MGTRTEQAAAASAAAAAAKEVELVAEGFMRIKEAADKLGVSRSTVYKLMDDK